MGYLQLKDGLLKSIFFNGHPKVKSWPRVAIFRTLD